MGISRVLIFYIALSASCIFKMISYVHLYVSYGFVSFHLSMHLFLVPLVCLFAEYICTLKLLLLSLGFFSVAPAVLYRRNAVYLL